MKKKIREIRKEKLRNLNLEAKKPHIGAGVRGSWDSSALNCLGAGNDCGIRQI